MFFTFLTWLNNVKVTFLMTTCFLFIFLMNACSFAFDHPGGLHSKTLLNSVQENIVDGKEPWASAYDKLRLQANENLLRTPDAVEDFNVPGYYDDPEGHRAAMDRLSDDGWAAYACAIAYQVCPTDSNVIYAEKALEVINNWAEVNKKASNFDGNLAMTDAGVGLVLAAELMSDYDGWTVQQRTVFQSWLSDVYLKCTGQIVNEINNWGDWAIFGQMASHYFLDDKEAMLADIESLKSKIDKEISANGSMPLETGREKRGMWYTYFALAPMTAAAQIGEQACGADILRYKGKDGAGLEEALDYLFHFCLYPDEWPHYSGSDLQKPKTTRWPASLYEGMSTLYCKREYTDWVKSSAPIMQYGHHYAWAAPTLLQAESFQISGTVVNAENNEPIANMLCILYDQNKQPLAKQYTNADGVFMFGSCPADSYYVEATGSILDGKELTPVFEMKFYAQTGDQETLLLLSENITGIDFSMQAFPSGLESNPNIEWGYQLEQNYPNPFNPSTNIPFELPASGSVSLQIYDVQGRVVYDAGHELLAAGSHFQEWDGLNMSGEQVCAGIYLYRLEYESIAGETQVLTRKMSLVR